LTQTAPALNFRTDLGRIQAVLGRFPLFCARGRPVDASGRRWPISLSSTGRPLDVHWTPVANISLKWLQPSISGPIWAGFKLFAQFFILFQPSISAEDSKSSCLHSFSFFSSPQFHLLLVAGPFLEYPRAFTRIQAVCTVFHSFPALNFTYYW
jgi:hypothetical protein